MISTGNESRKVVIQEDFSGPYHGVAVVGRGNSFLILPGFAGGSSDWNFAMRSWDGSGKGPLRLPTLKEAETICNFREKIYTEMQNADRGSVDQRKYSFWTTGELDERLAWSVN